MKTCTHSILAQSGSLRVDHCGCGTINLHLGSVSLRVSPQALMQLSEVLKLASGRYLETVSRAQTRKASPEHTDARTSLENHNNLHLNAKSIEDIH